MQSEPAFDSREAVRGRRRKRGGGNADGPVFVDNSGRRSKLLRRIGILLGVGCLAYAVVLGAAFMGWGTTLTPSSLLPFGGDGQNGQRPGGFGPNGGVGDEVGAPGGTAPTGTPPTGTPPTGTPPTGTPPTGAVSPAPTATTSASASESASASASESASASASAVAG